MDGRPGDMRRGSGLPWKLSAQNVLPHNSSEIAFKCTSVCVCVCEREREREREELHTLLQQLHALSLTC